MKLTNYLNLPKPFVDAVSSEYSYKDKQYSVTTILKGTREAILQRRHNDEIEQDVSDMVWLIFGSAVHSILEKAEEDFSQLKENWLVIDLPNGYKLSGIFDLYDVLTGTVTDYKTATVWKVIYDDWEDYRKQTLIYCWMLRQKGYNAKRGEIVAMLKDHSKSKAKFDSNYPQYPVYKIGWNFTEKDFEEIEKWIYDKFKEIEEQEKLTDDELMLCSLEDRWSEPTKYAVMKEGRKTAIRVLEDEEKAKKLKKELGDKHYIEVRKGKDKKCSEYCSCCEFCNYYKKNYKEG